MTEISPLVLYRTVVPDDWLDYNGHMNVAHYAAIFDRGLDAFFDHMQIGSDYARAAGCSMFVVENHFTYQRELLAGDGVSIRLQLLDRDRKRIHCFMELYHDEGGYLAATSEQIALHVDLGTRKSLSMPQTAITRLSDILESHRRIARPKEIGHKIGIRRRRLVVTS